LNLRFASIPGLAGDLPIIGGFDPGALIIRLEAEPDLVLISFFADPLLFKLLGGMPGLSEEIAVGSFALDLVELEFI
jgi:hypothetical protein